MRHKISFLLSAAILLLAACTADDVQLTPDASAPQGDIIGATLHFDCAYPSAYDDATDTRAAEQWQTGDKIFIYFSANAGLGTAVRQANGTWLLNVTNLGAVDNGTCSVFFFTKYSGDDRYDNPRLTFDPQDDDVIYRGDGTFTRSNDTFIIKASLWPRTCRIRFQGDAGTTLKILSSSNLAYAVSFIPPNIGFNNAERVLQLSGSPAYTDYIYPTWGGSDGNVNIDIEYKGSKYTRVIQKTSLKSDGKYVSCCIKLPSLQWLGRAARSQ